jgi:hypothetical protein
MVKSTLVRLPETQQKIIQKQNRKKMTLINQKLTKGTKTQRRNYIANENGASISFLSVGVGSICKSWVCKTDSRTDYELRDRTVEVKVTSEKSFIDAQYKHSQALA